MSGTLGASDDCCDASPSSPLLPTSGNLGIVVDVVYIHGVQSATQNGAQWYGRPKERCSPAFHQRSFIDRSSIEALSEQRPLMQRWLDEWLPVTDEKEKCLLETTRERTDQTNRALIWVADDSTAPTLIQTLRRADASAHTERRKLVDSTYGVIHLRSRPRHSTLYTSLLVAGQCVCYSVLSIYDQSRDGFYLSSSNDSGTFAHTLLPDTLNKPTTSTFVIVALVYGILAMIQYHINASDCFQQLLLVSGLAAGVLLSPSVPFSVPESPVSLHTFAATTTVALACSACGHWVWRAARPFSSTQETRLERKIQEWREDARGMVRGRHVVRLAELF